jgi:hypothetical protein
MTPKYAVSFSIAALSFALVIPAVAQSTDQSSMQGQQNQSSTTTPMRGAHEAMRMVPAQAVLKQTLDANKDHDGFQFRAVLSNKVKLDNGTKLPEGTVLLGNVTTDDLNVNGQAKLAIRFTQALLKNGQTLPVKATIVSVVAAQNARDDGYASVPNSWNDGTLAVDEIGVAKGVDLHSRVASNNSGVFVSTTDKDVKLSSGSQFSLAIAASNGPQAAYGNN